MTKLKRLPLLVLLAGIFLVVITSSVAIVIIWGNKPFQNAPLHSTLEALGAMSAILMGLVLLRGRWEQELEKYSPLAGGFLGMGIIDAFHAVSAPGQAFILLHSMASFAGGLGSVMIWSRKYNSLAHHSKRLSWITAGASVAFGIFALRYGDVFPPMIRNNVFSAAAVSINMMAGILFIATLAFFLLDFSCSHTIESYLFSCLYLLFGLAELEFPFSGVWNGNWWFWHVQRLGAYFVVLYFLFGTFRRIATERENLIIQLHHAFAEVKQLSGLLPICASCKRIRDEKGSWKQLEVFISQNSEAQFSHSLCPECSQKTLEEFDLLRNK